MTRLFDRWLSHPTTHGTSDEVFANDEDLARSCFGLWVDFLSFGSRKFFEADSGALTMSESCLPHMLEGNFSLPAPGKVVDVDP